MIVRGHGAKECLVESREGGRVTPDIVIRMRGATCPGPGMSRDMRLRNSDPPVDGSLSHGIKSASSEQVKAYFGSFSMYQNQMTSLSIVLLLMYIVYVYSVRIWCTYMVYVYSVRI